MKCSENTANLAAYLHDELTSYDEDTFQLHLSVCIACRDKHAKARDVLLRFQRTVPMEPSAIAREDLHRSIDVALRKSGSQPPIRFRDGSEVRWRRPFAAKPFALPMRRTPALPAPAAPTETPANANPGATPVPSGQNVQNADTLSPSARVVSARLESITRRRKRLRVRRGFWMALAVVALAGGVFTYWTSRNTARPVTHPTISKEECLARQRWNERHAAFERQHDGGASLLINRQIDLTGQIGTTAVRVVPHVDPHSGESCLVIYREEDLRAIYADEQYDPAAFKKTLGSSMEVVPVNGNIALPAQWIETCVGAENRVVILKLENRLEFWSYARLEKYLATGPTFDATANLAVVNGLPVVDRRF